MKFIVLGTTPFTLSCTQALLDSRQEVIALISMPKNILPLNSLDLSIFAKENNIDYLEFENINSLECIKKIQKYSPDYILSSWPKILKNKLLSIPKKYIIGTHPTPLPYNRGRHPLHWMIVLGIQKTMLSFFKMDQGIDTGSILLQIPFNLSANDTILQAVNKLSNLAYNGTRKLCKILKKDPLYKGHSQRGPSNYWRKRTPHDVILDCRMSVDMILKIVRSFSPPYPCAKLIIENNIIEICNAKKINFREKSLKWLEHGKLVNIRDNKLTLKVEGGFVELESRIPILPSMFKGNYIHPPTKYLIPWSENLQNKLSI